MLRRILVLAFPVLLFGCAEEKPEPSNPVVPKKEFVSDTLYLAPNEFPSNYNDTILEMLQAGKICTTDSSKMMQEFICDPNYWRVFRLGPGIPYSDGLICESRSLMFNGGALKNVLVLKRLANGQVDKVNHLLGKLLELRSPQPGYYELVMSYRDGGSTVTVKHIMEEDYYKAVDVEEINDGFVKEEFKDSINQFYLSDFHWGL